MPNDEVKDKFKNLVNQSGHPLENNVEKILKTYFTSVRRNPHYLDKDNAKDRDFDFNAKSPCYVIPPSKKNQLPIVTMLELVIECKKLPDHAWIFTGSETNRISNFSKVGYMDKLHHIFPDFHSDEPIPADDIKGIIPYLDKKIFTANSYQEQHLTNKKTRPQKQPKNSDEQTDNPIDEEFRSNHNNKNLYKAMNEVIKATRFRLDYYKENNRNWINKKFKPTANEIIVIQPLIVFQGYMYKTIEKDNEIDLEPIRFVRMEKEYLSDKYNETVGDIHVVHVDGLVEYLQMLHLHYKTMDPTKSFGFLFGRNDEPNDRLGFI